MWRYEAMLAKRGWQESKQRFREAKGRMMGYLVQTAILGMILYFAPWFGNVDSESRLVLATGGAFVLWAVLAVIWDQLRAASLVDADRMRAIEVFARYYRLDADRAAMVKRGEALYEQGATHLAEENEYMLEMWEREVAEFVERHYDTQANFYYKWGGGKVVKDPNAKRDVVFFQERLYRFHHVVGTYQSEDAIRFLKFQGTLPRV